MRINSVNNPQPSQRTEGLQRQANGKKSVDTSMLSASESLDRALESEPSTRAEAVEKARKLVGDVAYPPPETVKRLANLLAISVNNDRYQDEES